MDAQSEPDRTSTFPLQGPAFRGRRRLRLALVGLPRSGKRTIFQAVASTRVERGTLAGTDHPFEQCTVAIGTNEAHLVGLASIRSLRHLDGDQLEALKYLLWGDSRPLISRHERSEPPAPFARPDVIIQVIDASVLDRSLELTLELSQLGVPVVIALNMMDEARRKGVQIDTAELSRRLGVPVVPMVALKGHGIIDLFNAAVDAARHSHCLLPQATCAHLQTWSHKLDEMLADTPVNDAFRVPPDFLALRLFERDPYFDHEFASHFPELVPRLNALRAQADTALPRPISEEVGADLHHRATSLFESVAGLVSRSAVLTWEDRLDALFLDPRWGLLSSLVIFAFVLFVVFEVSAVLDAFSAARLADWVSAWEPTSLLGVIGRAVTDGLVGLVGIVVPYMLPLVLMLVALEESGVMPRIAFVADRFFHRIGLHGKVAVPFLLGLGCNVPAIAATTSVPSGRDRVVASLLITFVPCSARSAVILALGGKYLGGLGVFAIFMINLVLIAVLGHLLSRRYPETSPGLIQEIPPYALPDWRAVSRATWERTRDILTIVTPLLVGGSVVLALLHFAGADTWINVVLAPITSWLLGLPEALGVPILFGVLRKELSLLMIYQALGTFEVGEILNWIQITTFLVFLTFYIPCVSTFAVMLKIIGRREAIFSILLSISVALICAVAVRLVLEAVHWIV